jgi:hypothetical protein
MAGNSFTVTVTALDANNNPVPSYAGTVHFTSSDSQAGLPPDATLANGTGNFSVTLKTAGSQTVTVTDTANGSLTGSATVTVTPANPSKLMFGQGPSNAAPGAVISGGVATFSNLSINNAGNGYTLTASSGSLTGATSASFNVSASTANLIEGFENNPTYYVTGFGNVNAVLGTYAAHDGTYGLDMWASQDWIYRNDSAVQVKAGDTISVWLQFAGSTDGRAYFGFGSSASGTLSIVAAPNTGQLILQRNQGYGFTNMAAVSASYQPNHWYRLEVDWGTSGKIVGKLFDSDGLTLLHQVSARTTSILSGGIAFRATGSDKYFDTVTDTSGVNNFAVPVAGASGGGTVTIGQPPRFWEGGSQFLVTLGGRGATLTTAEQLFAAGPKNWHLGMGLLGASEWGGWF